MLGMDISRTSRARLLAAGAAVAVAAFAASPASAAPLVGPAHVQNAPLAVQDAGDVEASTTGTGDTFRQMMCRRFGLFCD